MLQVNRGRMATSMGRETNGLLMTRASRRWKTVLVIGIVAAALFLFLSGEDGYVRVHAKKQSWHSCGNESKYWKFRMTA